MARRSRARRARGGLGWWLGFGFCLSSALARPEPATPPKTETPRGAGRGDAPADPLAPDPISRELAALTDRQAHDLKQLLDLETDPAEADPLRLRLAGLLFRRAVEFESDAVLLRARDRTQAELYAQRAVADEQAAEDLLRGVLLGGRDSPARTEALERLARMLIRRADEARDRGQTALGIREEAVDLLAELAPRLPDKQARVSALRVQAEQLLSLEGRAQRQRAAAVIRAALALDPESGAERVRIYSLAGRAAEELDDAGDALGLYVTTLREAADGRRSDAVVRAEQGLVRTLGRMGDGVVTERILDDVGPAGARLRPSVAVSLADNGHAVLALAVLDRGLRLASDAELRRELRLLHLRVAAQSDDRDAVSTDLQALRAQVPPNTAVAPPEWTRSMSEVVQAALRARWSERPWSPPDEERAEQTAARFPLGAADTLRRLLLAEVMADPAAPCAARLDRYATLRAAFRAAPAVTDRVGDAVGTTRDLGYEVAARSLNHLLACRPTGDGTPPRPLMLADDEDNFLFFKEILASHSGLVVSVDLARGEALAARGDTEAALVAFEAALKVDGAHVPATAERVVALLLDRQDWAAATRRADALATDPRLDAATREQMLHVADRAALAQIEQGEAAARGPLLARFIAERPESPLLPNARLALAEVLTAEGRHLQAAAVLQQAAEAGGPSRATRQATARLADWHLARGDVTEAVRWQGRLAHLLRAGGAGESLIVLSPAGEVSARPRAEGEVDAADATRAAAEATLAATEANLRRLPPTVSEVSNLPPGPVLATWSAEARLRGERAAAARLATLAEAAGLPDARWNPVVAWAGTCVGVPGPRRPPTTGFDPTPWIPRLRAACGVAEWRSEAEALLDAAPEEAGQPLAEHAEAVHRLVQSGPGGLLGDGAAPETRVQAWLVQARLGEGLAQAMVRLSAEVPELGPQGEAWRTQARGLWRETRQAVRGAAAEGADAETLWVLERWLGAALFALADTAPPAAAPTAWGLP